MYSTHILHLNNLDNTSETTAKKMSLLFLCILLLCFAAPTTSSSQEASPLTETVAAKGIRRLSAPSPDTLPPFHFIHIPKTAGESFIQDIQRMTKDATSLGFKSLDGKTSATKENMLALEYCFKVLYDPRATNIVSMRGPRAHVYSQFLECKYDEWGKTTTKEFNFPRSTIDELDTNDFKRWLEAFLHLPPNSNLQLKDVGDFNCYDPRNMMTRYLSDDHIDGKSPDKQTCGHFYRNESLDRMGEFYLQAEKNLQTLDLVLLQEFYVESICLLAYKMFRELPQECQCGGGSAEEHAARADKLKMHHEVHGVPHHSWKDLSADIHKLVDGYTYYDRKLYLKGVSRFVADINKVEKAVNASILCKATVKEFHHTHAYTYLSNTGNM